MCFVSGLVARSHTGEREDSLPNAPSLSASKQLISGLHAWEYYPVIRGHTFYAWLGSRRGSKVILRDGYAVPLCELKMILLKATMNGPRACLPVTWLVVYAAPLNRMEAVVTTTLFGFAHTAQGSKAELTSHQPILLAVESTE